jgi:hypothetical protein
MTSILIVEDEAIVATDIAEQVRELGYEVSGIADTGTDAIELAEQLHPQLILMDIVLKGGMKGFDAAQYIQTHYEIPVIFLTAYSDPSTLNQADQTHPFGYLLKPFNIQQLAASIQMALSRRQAEQSSLHRALQVQASQINQLKGKYLTMVLRELRGPITTIQTATHLLRARFPILNKGKAAEYLQMIQSAITSTGELIADVDLLCLIESGEMTLTTSLIDVVSFCQEFVDHFKQKLYPRQTLVFESNTPLELVKLDRNLLHRILYHLISNAVKYSQEKGKILLSLTALKNELKLQIQDQGTGVPPVDQDQIFTAFYRGSNVGKTKGSGLGLAIVKECVKLHQGQISFHTQSGFGTTVTVSLPVGLSSSDQV